MRPVGPDLLYTSRRVSRDCWHEQMRRSWARTAALEAESALIRLGRQVEQLARLFNKLLVVVDV